MAYIDKVCEYSGEYPEPAWMMYRYKRNLIQVLPQYRKLFKGKEYTLSFCFEEFVFSSKEGEIYSDETYIRGYKRSKEYIYCLNVPSLPGEVNGRYINYTNDLRAVKRKLRKLLRVRRLKYKVRSKITRDENGRIKF